MAENAEEVEVDSPYKMAELREYGISSLEKASPIYNNLKSEFLRGMGDMAAGTNVVAVHRSAAAEKESFFPLLRATAAKGAGGTIFTTEAAGYLIGSSREDIYNIVKNGFTRPEPSIAAALAYYGVGSLVFVPSDRSLESAMWSIPEEGGMRHVVQCCLMMGKSEIVNKDSGQTRPSSQEFDSGVDDLVNPSKYIVWGDFINPHIFPNYIVSFTAPHLDVTGIYKMPELFYDDDPSTTLFLATLPKIVKQERVRLVEQISAEYRARMRCGGEVIDTVTAIIGDELLKKLCNWVQNKSL